MKETGRRKAVLEAGAAAYLVKPNDLDFIVSTITGLIEAKK